MKNYVPADLVIYKTGQGIVLKEKTLIAYNTENKKILAIGNEAEKMDNDSPNVACMSPFHLGEIDDYACAVTVMKYCIQKAFGKMLLKPAMVLCVPEHVDEMALKIYEEVMLGAEVRKVKVYMGTLNAFLECASEKELKQYMGIMEISKDNPLEYAGEMICEVYDCAKKWGVSKAQLLEILENA